MAFRARGRTVRRVAGEMNKLEATYAQQLELRLRVGEILRYDFDAIKLRLADKCFYTPDFMVMLRDGSIEFHEVKGGFWEEDARVKIKVAAQTYGLFQFIAVTKPGKSDWQFERF